MQNGLIWSTLGAVFSKKTEKDDHSGFSGVTTHENGRFLYKSRHAMWAGSERVVDYLALALGGGFLFANQWIFAVPLLLMTARMPRQILQMKYFTLHAELLPHTEQVVFTKANLFGRTDRYYVDIANLEKIYADSMDQEMLWQNNLFDD